VLEGTDVRRVALTVVSTTDSCRGHHAAVATELSRVESFATFTFDETRRYSVSDQLAEEMLAQIQQPLKLVTLEGMKEVEESVYHRIGADYERTIYTLNDTIVVDHPEHRNKD
jgi:hypothetical protein